VAAKKKAQTKERGVGDAAQDALKDGLTNEEALAAVRKEFPKSNCSLASINWYRNQLRKNGARGVKSARELNKQRKAQAEKAAKKASKK